MIEGDGYIFHLDAPGERPAAGGEELLGWIASLEPVRELRLLGGRPRELNPMPRPDVQAVFPGRPHATGFSGRVTAADLSDGGLSFSFLEGSSRREVTVPLPVPPAPPRGWERLRARMDRWTAGRLLRRASTPRARWNASLRLLLSEARLRRGASFRRAEIDLVLDLFARTFPEAVVVQIGANDGATGDPIAPLFDRTRWSGLLVEPIPRLAALLRARHAGRPSIIVEQAAVAEADGETTIHRVAEAPGDPLWFQQLASLDRSVLLKHSGAIPGLEGRIVAETVPALTAATLLRRHKVDRIDLLVIDTEGYDYRILRQFDLRRLSPSLVLFEHQHLPEADRRAARAMLGQAGYRLVETPEGDALAWRGA